VTWFEFLESKWNAKYLGDFVAPPLLKDHWNYKACLKICTGYILWITNSTTLLISMHSSMEPFTNFPNRHCDLGWMVFGELFRQTIDPWNLQNYFAGWASSKRKFGNWYFWALDLFKPPNFQRLNLECIHSDPLFCIRN